MTNDEILMTNQCPNDQWPKESGTAAEFVIGAWSLIGLSCFVISHYISHYLWRGCLTIRADMTLLKA